jgi:sugar phosphate isomerase/epimerase
MISTVPAAIGAGLSGCLSASAAPPVEEKPLPEPFGYCLNTSTISGQKLTITESADIAAKAGYQGIEPWIRELDAHVKAGGSLSDLGKRIRDLGLSVESTIGFFEWVVDDDARREKGLDEAKRNFEMVQQIGGKRLAAPPVGATDRTDLNLPKIAERYRALLELGDRFGVVAEAEVWGFSKTLGRLSEAVFVAIESGHSKACILPDVFHLFKGGSGVSGVRLLSGSAIGIFHFNDYPASPPREKLTDAQRVYPGDGIALLNELVRSLSQIGYRGMLSLELFNHDYWRQDALQVAKTGLEKMRAIVRGAMDL